MNMEIKYDMIATKLTAEQLADISSEWENSTVDTSKYYQAVMTAWEVSKDIYYDWREAGGLCQEYRGKFYIA